MLDLSSAWYKVNERTGRISINQLILEQSRNLVQHDHPYHTLFITFSFLFILLETGLNSIEGLM